MKKISYRILSCLLAFCLVSGLNPAYVKAGTLSLGITAEVVNTGNVYSIAKNESTGVSDVSFNESRTTLMNAVVDTDSGSEEMTALDAGYNIFVRVDAENVSNFDAIKNAEYVVPSGHANAMASIAASVDSYENALPIEFNVYKYISSSEDGLSDIGEVSQITETNNNIPLTVYFTVADWGTGKHMKSYSMLRIHDYAEGSVAESIDVHQVGSTNTFYFDSDVFSTFVFLYTTENNKLNVTCETDGNGTAEAYVADGEGKFTVPFPTEAGGVEAGTDVMIKAVPAYGYKLKEWNISDDSIELTDPSQDGTEYHVKLTAGTEDKTVTVNASFVLADYSISIDVGSAHGSVEIDEAHADYKGKLGDAITLTPTAEDGWHFAGWEISPETTKEGDPVNYTTDPDTGVLTFTMTGEDMIFVPVFVEDEAVHVITLTNTGRNTGGGEITADTESAKVGDKVTLTVIPGTGSVLDTIRVVQGELAYPADFANEGANMYSFIMPDGDVELQAVFRGILHTINITNADGYGEGKSYVNEIETDKAKEGDIVVIKASPSDPDRYAFEKWITSDAVTIADPNASVTSFKMIASDVTINAAFEALSAPQHEITASKSENGTYDIEPSPAAEGSTVTITTHPDPGYKVKTVTARDKDGNITVTKVTDNVYTFLQGTEDVTVTVTYEKETYAINVTVSDSVMGTATASSTKGQTGDVITITAAPASDDYEFSGWSSTSGVVFKNSKSASTSFAMKAGPANITANFAAVKREITIDYDATQGTAVARPASAGKGETVTITAAAKNGYFFGGWDVIEGDVVVASPGVSTTTFLMGEKPVKLKAYFESTSRLDPDPGTTTRHSVDLHVTGSGKVTASLNSAVKGTKVVLTAQAYDGYYFDQWIVNSGAVTIEDEYSANTSFAMGDANVDITGVFESEKYTVTMKDDGHGQAYTSLATAGKGETVTINASPDDGYKFASWTVVSGSVSLVSKKLVMTSFAMPAGDVVIKAAFKKIGAESENEYTLTVQTDGNGNASASKSTGKKGEEITIKAQANTGYKFKKWESSGSASFIDNTKSSTRVVMPGNNCTIKAVFEKESSSTSSGSSSSASGNTTKTAIDDTLYSSIFKDWNGVVIKTVTSKFGAALQEPAKPGDFTMDGKIYSFVCWLADTGYLYDGICRGNHVFTAMYYVTGESKDTVKSTESTHSTTVENPSSTTSKIEKTKTEKVVVNAPDEERVIPTLYKDNYTEYELQNLEAHSIKEEDLTDEEKARIEQILENNKLDESTMDNNPNVRPAAIVSEDVEEEEKGNPLIWLLLIALLLLLGGGVLLWVKVIKPKIDQKKSEEEEEGEEVSQSNLVDDDGGGDSDVMSDEEYERERDQNRSNEDEF
ncbi:MAG: InlB B-repeat-containing protein [Lachnospiraceae bacterium]|nr:InlB B-repeat-containing protein [Lachnospiraceae bacterium]